MVQRVGPTFHDFQFSSIIHNFWKKWVGLCSQNPTPIIIIIIIIIIIKIQDIGFVTITGWIPTS